jgi:hypothetical protein
LNSGPRRGKPLDGRICRASELAVRARANLDLFAFLICRTNRDKFADVLADRPSLFEFTCTAHEHQFLARIAFMRAMERVLADAVRRCSAGELPGCPIIDTIAVA